MRRLSRPTWIKPLRFGKYVWNTPFHRGLHGRWIINSCVGITPYVAGGSYEDAQGLMQVDSGDASQFSGAEIKIACGPEMPGSVGYMLNGTEYDMQPGYSQKFAEDRTWVIQFRSGDENSEIVEFTLTAGEYQFVVVDGKLNLTPVSQDGLQSVSPEVQQDVAPEVQQDVAPEAAQNVVPDVTLQQFNSDGSASP